MATSGPVGEIMSIILYELSAKKPETKFSPHCWKTRLALIHKNLSFEGIAVQFGEKEKIKFSGQTLLPVLSDGEVTVADSWDIACYLEENYPKGPSLFTDDAAKALAESIDYWCSTSLSMYIRPLVLMKIYHLIDDDDKVYFRESRENKLGMSLEEFDSKPDEALYLFREELSAVRELLVIQPYLGGLEPSYADICLLGTLLWIACVSDIVFLDDNDIVNSWYRRMLDQYPAAKSIVSQLVND